MEHNDKELLINSSEEYLFEVKTTNFKIILNKLVETLENLDTDDENYENDMYNIIIIGEELIKQFDLIQKRILEFHDKKSPTNVRNMEKKIEKIPLICSNTLKLLGLITLKNIKHWENNKFKACIDATGALCVGAAIGIIDDYMERLDKLVAANVDIICVDVANGFNSHVIDTIKKIREKYPHLLIMAGNVCNSNGYESLATIDIDCIR